MRKRSTRRAPVRRSAGRKKNGKGGHSFWFFLFFIAAAIAAAMVLHEPAPAPGTAQVPQKEQSTAQRILDTIKDTGRAAEKAVTGGETGGKPKEEPARRNSPKKETPQNVNGAGRGTDGTPAAASAPAAAVKGKMAVVIDDAGRDLASQRVYEKMGIPLTLAVMPNQVHTSEAAAEWAGAGLPVIIHQPMESVSGSGMEPIVLLTSMSDTAKRQMLSDSFRQIPQASGMNNHQGSKATTDRHTMDIVMNELSHRGLFFLDSATNTTTAADAAAAAYGVGYARNELFVDNSSDVEEIKAMIRKGARMAIANGSAIIIGHCRPHTAEAFRQVVPELRREGIQFIYVSQLMQ